MSDLTFDCPECSHNLIVDAQAAGMVVACPECGTQIRVPNLDPDLDVVAAVAPEAEPAPAPEMVATAAMREYRVVGMIEGDGIAGRITPGAVEFKLNELQQEGWQFRSATTIQTRNAQGNPRQELLLIVEREL